MFLIAEFALLPTSLEKERAPPILTTDSDSIAYKSESTAHNGPRYLSAADSIFLFVQDTTAFCLLIFVQPVDFFPF